MNAGAYARKTVVNTRSPRITITLTEPALSDIKLEAEHLGISIGELLRRIVDNHRIKGKKK